MNVQALIIDDERDICELIEMGLIAQDVFCDSAHNLKSAIKFLKEKQYDLIFCDIRLPDGDGLDFLTHINKHYPGIPVCMMTAHGNMDMAIRALKLGAFDFVNKPFELKQLRTICRAALKKSGLPAQAKVSNKTNKSAVNTDIQTEKTGRGRQTQLVGDAPVMVNVRQMIHKVASSQAPVFIHGESGTGKEVAARAIHEQSRRGDGPFVAVNCGAIPENLVESEFFGYKKGAFTGANQDKDGLFVAANGGTLFLDEVADLPLVMQVKLLRAIQERAIRPIGGDAEEAVDVRIISATHRDLAAKVRSGEFREDLYYRLNVIELTMPPLRERDGDVVVLAQFLLAKLAANAGYPEAKFSSDALTKLQSYTFPGNVRELENILERALTFMEGNTIEANDIHIQAVPNHQEESTLAKPKAAEMRSVLARSSEEDGAINPAKIDFYDFDLDSNFIPPPVKRREIASVRAIGSQSVPPPVQAVGKSTDTQRDLEQGLLQQIDISVPDEPPSDLEAYMQDMERQILLKALEESGNNKTKAAEALGISFRAMRYKLKKLGID